jgi:peroxiredoxin
MRPASLASLLLATLFTADAAAPPASTPPKPAPDFVLKSLTGQNLRLSEYAGQVVLLNFWATWAGASGQEIPQLEKLHHTYRSAGLVVLGINVDAEQTRAAEYARTLKISYPVLLDTRKQVAPAYGLKTLPMTVLIDRSGAVRYVRSGFEPGMEQDYVVQLRTLLDE